MNGVFTCVANALTLLAIGLLTMIIRSRAIMAVSAAVLVGVSVFTTYFLFENWLLLIAAPILSLIYLRRLMKFQDSDTYSRDIKNLLYIESFVIPIYIFLIELVVPFINYDWSQYGTLHTPTTFVQYVPSFIFGIGVITYGGMRVVSLSILGRLENGQIFFDKRSSVRIVTLVTVYSVIGIIVSFLGGDDHHSAPIYIPPLNMERSGGHLIGHNTNPKTPIVHKPVNGDALHWAIILLAFVTISGVVIYIKLNRKKTNEKILVHPNDNEELIGTRRERLSKTQRRGALFIRTNSLVRRRYQEMLRLMDNRGFPTRISETVREYSERLEGQDFKTNADTFDQGVQLLKGAYEETRYTPDKVESDALKRQAELGLKLLKSSLEKNVPS